MEDGTQSFDYAQDDSCRGGTQMNTDLTDGHRFFFGLPLGRLV